MTDKNLAAACGLYCGPCEYLGKQCRGCGNQAGKPFWTTHAKVEVCPLYDCCVNKKHLEHCGLCAELPCELFKEFHDPSLSPEEAQKSIHSREGDLIRRKEIGTEKWLKEKEA
ncbi:MAG: DUF3795 domain-containing protein [Candidatus Abyssobacteria bacterium SURF_17]|jgi:hypothetical protein|uniref:DUF3795 domain-containing protein n=1 Tax=Candidatus Abyssobacteria bacterium SURF_17 TaxID=2093361 RepID=A0A419ESV4_9BACT|nr:MAG: DUF3795 domain-containing protein [Candidatus Abyssubacteria bacterium SURF_17]